MDKNKIQRMRNLVSGDYGAKTKTSSGYRKYNHKKLLIDPIKNGRKIN